MTRIGFVLSPTYSGWTGGVNYLSNLLHAIAKLPSRQIDPVLVIHPSEQASQLDSFPKIDVLRTALANDSSRSWGLARKLAERGLGHDVLMTRYLRSHGIALLSHSGQLGARADIPSIGWLPDFQHLRMPEFFEPAELVARNRGYGRIAEQCSTVLLSSADAQRDLAVFAPAAAPRSRVLHFVSGFAGGDLTLPDEMALRKRYALVGPYFHLPNQFWAHKNHGVVIDALAELKSRNQPGQVVCTGQTVDTRRPTYFADLMRHVKDAGVAERFHVLGLVPYHDLAGLMRHSMAVVNPSLFEGWSTSVEEGKSLGLQVLLSDIGVHREQAPERGVFFDPRDSATLADAMIQVASSFSREAEQEQRARARASLPMRFIAFGERYQAIALETLASK